MLGLGETEGEIRETLGALRRVECKFLTIGRYLQPSRRHLPVERFVTPEEFDAFRETALAMGFREVASGPFVRTSPG
jgi:lipoic acid synthetase